MFDTAIFLAAFGITLLEMAEASAVGLSLHMDSGSYTPFHAVSLGVAVVLIPTALVGNLILIFPLFYVRLVSATLLLYFGVRLAKSARRSMKFQRIGFPKGKESDTEKSAVSTAFSVGLVEAFEAAIVLVALFPESYYSTMYGLLIGMVAVVISVYLLRSQVRKVKQATVKVAVSAILLAFSLFWYLESVVLVNDLMLVPFFVVFFIIVYYLGSRDLPPKPSVNVD